MNAGTRDGDAPAVAYLLFMELASGNIFHGGLAETNSYSHGSLESRKGKPPAQPASPAGGLPTDLQARNQRRVL